MYILNKNTHCYHIRGGCHNAVANENNNLRRRFNSEGELRSYDPDAWLCKICQKKREELERENQGI